LFDAAFERAELSSSLHFPGIGGKVPAKTATGAAEQSGGSERFIIRAPSDRMNTWDMVSQIDWQQEFLPIEASE
jgi:hypothetical protein